MCVYVCAHAVDEADIIELEKQYWSLKGTSKSGRFDVETLTAVVSPPMPQQLCQGLAPVCLLIATVAVSTCRTGASTASTCRTCHFRLHTYGRRAFSVAGPMAWNSHTHTHIHPFNGPFSGTTWVSRYQKGKTNLDFTEARDSEWQWHQLGHMQVCTSLQTDNHASISSLRTAGTHSLILSGIQ